MQSVDLALDHLNSDGMDKNSSGFLFRLISNLYL